MFRRLYEMLEFAVSCHAPSSLYRLFLDLLCRKFVRELPNSGARETISLSGESFRRAMASVGLLIYDVGAP
jgi:hypothetical protein